MHFLVVLGLEMHSTLLTNYFVVVVVVGLCAMKYTDHPLALLRSHCSATLTVLARSGSSIIITISPNGPSSSSQARACREFIYQEEPEMEVEVEWFMEQHRTTITVEPLLKWTPSPNEMEQTNT